MLLVYKVCLIASNHYIYFEVFKSDLQDQVPVRDGMVCQTYLGERAATICNKMSCHNLSHFVINFFKQNFINVLFYFFLLIKSFRQTCNVIIPHI